MTVCARPADAEPRRAAIPLAPLLALCLVGCATPQAGVTPLGGEYFSIVREAPTALTPVAKLQAEAMALATRFCADRKATVQVLNVRDSKGWSAAGNTPRVEVQFSCVPTPPEPLPPTIGQRKAPAADVPMVPSAAPASAASAPTAAVAPPPVASAASQPVRKRATKSAAP